MFHSQNHAVVHSESMTGQEITAENTANAPLEMRIYGASRQEQTAEPDSPSPDYPSEIKGAVDFEVGSGNTTATIDQVLRGIPDGSGGWAARDYIEVKDGIVRLVRECGEIAFDGTEVWYDYIANFGVVSYNLPHKPSTPILCTHGRNDRKADGGFVGWSSVSAIGFYPERAGVDSVAGWKAWLAAQNTAGSPVKVVYALDVAQVTDITSTELGQALSGMKSVQYYTRIYHNSALPVELEAAVTKLGRG